MKSETEIKAKIAEYQDIILNQSSDISKVLLIGARLHVLRWVLDE